MFVLDKINLTPMTPEEGAEIIGSKQSQRLDCFVVKSTPRNDDYFTPVPLPRFHYTVPFAFMKQHRASHWTREAGGN